MEEIEIKNAIIRDVSISTDDGFLTAYLHLEYGNGSCQSFGGLALYLPKSFTHHDIKGYAGHFIFRCMEIAGVKEWQKVAGKSIRVKASYGKVHAIGNIIEEDWFDPKHDFSNGYEK